VRLIVAGSRNLHPTHDFINWHINEFQMNTGLELTTLVCGMAPGVDTAAKRWAEANSIPIEEYPANWKKYGKAAGPLRNHQMAANADALLLIWNGESRGSASMKREAEAAGLLIHEVIM